MIFKNTIPLIFGGKFYAVGQHTADIKQDWFYCSLIDNGYLEIIEEPKIEQITPVIQKRKRRKNGTS